MNDMRAGPHAPSEFRVVGGGAGLAARGVGKTYKKRPVVRNVRKTVSPATHDVCLVERN